MKYEIRETMNNQQFSINKCLNNWFNVDTSDWDKRVSIQKKNKLVGKLWINKLRRVKRKYEKERTEASWKRLMAIQKRVQLFQSPKQFNGLDKMEEFINKEYNDVQVF